MDADGGLVGVLAKHLIGVLLEAMIHAMKNTNATDFIKSAVLSLLLASLVLPSCAQNTEHENIALHRPVTFSAPPNYGLTKDADDAKQITDGVYTKGKLWTQKTSVGWEEKTPVILTIDLGMVQPIGGVSFNTAAGNAGVTWPASIVIAVSDDAQSWRYAGDLVTLDETGEPAPGYRTHRYVTRALKTKGRYLALGVIGKPYLFTDEIEIYRGSDALLSQERVGAQSDNINRLLLYNAVQRRLHLDWQSVAAAVTASPLSTAAKQQLQAQLAELRGEMGKVPLSDPATFKAILPFNDLHARILAVHSAVLRARQLPPLVAWKKHRYDYLDPLDAPAQTPASPPALSIEMMRNEQRAEAFLLTNATPQPVVATLRIEGLPGVPRPSWLSISPVTWTDTFYYMWVASALPETEYSQGAYQVTIPAGVTRKVWIGVDSSQLAPGEHRGTLRIEGAGRELRLPLNVRVSPLVMQRPRLSLSMWDYTSGDGQRAIQTAFQTLRPALSLMQSHYVDTTWSERTLPWPRAADFDANGNLTGTLDFAAFDEWIQRWPDARHYIAFLNTLRDNPGFGGAEMGTPEFNARVGAWARALAARMRSLKIPPERLGLEIVDEPHHDFEAKTTVAWLKAIKAAAPELTIFTNPTWEHPEQVKEQESITGADIVSPEMSKFFHADDSAREYYAARRAAGQTLWFYQVGDLVPAHTRDPSQFYRGQAWRAFGYGATGEGFWAFGDIGGARSSWMPYLAPGIAYAPVFFETRDELAAPLKRVTGSLHWEATREGVEDYEYLAMLRDAATHSDKAALKKQAEQLLAELPSLLGEYPSDIRWNSTAPQPSLDEYRLKVLRLLEQMENAHSLN